MFGWLQVRLERLEEDDACYFSGTLSGLRYLFPPSFFTLDLILLESSCLLRWVPAEGDCSCFELPSETFSCSHFAVWGDVLRDEPVPEA